MENNENMNSQISENNSQVTDNKDTNQSNKGNNNVLVIIMALIIVGLVGYIVYAKFIQKGDEPKETNPTVTSTSETTPEPTNEPSSTSTPSSTPVSADKNVYKTADGKHSLNVKDFKNKSNPKLVYDGKTINVAKDDSDGYGLKYEKIGKYALYGDGKGQCGEYIFIVNTETNTLINLDAKKNNRVEQIGNNYYFIQTESCSGEKADYHKGVYTENMKKIGKIFLGEEFNNNYFYVIDNGIIVKYDSSGKVVLKSNEVYNLAKDDDFAVMIDDSGAYFLIVSNGEMFFIDSNAENLKPIKIGTTSEYNYDFSGEDLSISPMDDGIYINLFDKENKSLNIVYDTKTKTIIK